MERGLVQGGDRDDEGMIVMPSSSATCMHALGLVWVYGMLPWVFFFRRFILFITVSRVCSYEVSHTSSGLPGRIVGYMTLFAWPSNIFQAALNHCLVTMAMHLLCCRGWQGALVPKIKNSGRLGTEVTEHNNTKVLIIKLNAWLPDV